ncbi:putative type VI secretion system effector [Tatumella saanichensis]|uniref:putative type VI secretion system effector n=1 Tax=Tatumella saanichensis TaxID=480813 RepID=UPI0004A37B3F|nr:putative type VI secretion system effector [Tatumella saanichensis]
MNSEEQQICSRFVEPEKLADLRTKQEIEVMNGRPWVRELPPPPVLPPYGPLEKISGQLESFRYEGFREYFGPNAYRTSTLPELSGGQRGAAAAGAIVAGSPGVGAVMMAESESSNDSAEYVQGTINGQPFRGWVGVTRLQAGDNVEMIAEWQHDHYEVYAIALPEERIVSVCPECDRGHIAHMLWRIKNMFILTAMLIFMFACICLIKSLNEEGWEQLDFWKEYFVFLMMMLGLAFLFSGALAFFAYKAYAPTCCKLAEEIFNLLGMKNVKMVNLNKTTKDREKHLIECGTRPNPVGEKRFVTPSAKFIYSLEWWFYY